MSKIRFLHVADVHLDSSFSGANIRGDQLSERRSDLFLSFKRAIETGMEQKVDFYVIAGDLFEEEYVRTNTLNRVFTLIGECAPAPVIISPGNHDPYHPRSPYYFSEYPDNLKLFTSQEISRIDMPEFNLAVYGLAFNSPHIQERLWESFTVEKKKDEISVVVTHAAFQKAEIMDTGPYLPISKEDILSSGADYFALGHNHIGKSVVIDDFKKSVRAAYPGSPEQMRFGNDGDHGALVVSIDSESGAVETEHFSTQRKKFHSLEIILTDQMQQHEIDKKILGILGEVNSSENCVELSVNGRISTEVAVEPEHYLSAAEKIFQLKLKIDTEPAFDIEAISSEKSVRGKYCRILLDKIAASDEVEEKRILEETLHAGLCAFDGQNVAELPL